MAIRGNSIQGAIGWVAGAAIVAMALPAAASDGPSGPESRSTFKSGIDVVALSVTVLDPQARLLAGLSRDKFSVFEDGVRQDIAYFETSEVPLDLALLIDSSVSMEPRLAFVQKAAAGFVDALREGDRAAVFAFNSYVRPLQAFTADRSLVRQAIQSTTAAGGTALYNAVYVALRAFDKVAEDGRVRRRAIVLLTDGEDTASVLTFDDLMAEAKAAGVTIYTIGLHAEEPSRYAAQQTRGYFSTADFAMKQLARETGAKAFFPTGLPSLAEAYAEIGRELATQYAIGYVSRNPMRNGAFRRVT
ncbi:MAG: VWA domain-containing protein, partial [Vicinamibacteria bacterium]